MEHAPLDEYKYSSLWLWVLSTEHGNLHVRRLPRLPNAHLRRKKNTTSIIQQLDDQKLVLKHSQVKLFVTFYLL